MSAPLGIFFFCDNRGLPVPFVGNWLGSVPRAVDVPLGFVDVNSGKSAGVTLFSTQNSAQSRRYHSQFRVIATSTSDFLTHSRLIAESV
jgi:hypothetical protein